MQLICRFQALFLLAGLTLALAVSGCQSRKAPPAARPAPRFSGQTLRIAASDGPGKLLAERASRAWAGETGAKVTFVPAETPDADLVLFPPAELAKRVAAGSLQPIANADSVSRLLPLYSGRLVLWDGTPYALPIRGDGVVLVYRLDLYDQAKLKPPADWDQFAEHASRFFEERKKPSLPPLPADAAGLDREFHAIAAPFACRAVTGAVSKAKATPDQQTARVFAFEYDLTTGLPRIDSVGFVDALKLLLKLQPFRSQKSDAASAFQADEAVLGLMTLSDLARLRDIPGGSGKWGIAKVPGSRRVEGQPITDIFANAVPYLGAGGTLGAVAKATPFSEAASELLNHLSGEAVSMEAVHEPEYGSGPFRDGHITRRPEGWATYGLSEEQTARLRDVLREQADPRLDNPAIVLRIPDGVRHRDALVAELRKALSGDLDAAQALKNVSQAWQALDGDPAKFREVYRKSLGL